MTVAPSKRTQVGQYELLEEIGAGGSGTVYRATCPETEQVVAIKVLSQEYASEPDLCRRMEQEFYAARTLEHRNIVKGIDFGVSDSVPYYVMEFVDGESLGERIRRDGPLAEEQAVGLLRQIGAAVKLIHEQNFIHRDIKPDNIFLTPAGVPKLGDLGLVKCLDSDINLTAHCGILGTPNYVAPEQFENAADVDCRADVYSLGSTLYTAITGLVPFFVRGKQNYLAILKKKLLNDLQLPRKFVPDLSESVDFAIRRAMRSDPNQRHANCTEFLNALEGNLLDDEKEIEVPGLVANGRRERRAAVRFEANLSSTCQPFTNFKEKSWTAKVADISTKGIRLLMPRRFEPGARLILEFTDANKNQRTQLTITVNRVSKENAKEWCLGCTMHRPLSVMELKTLLQV